MLATKLQRRTVKPSSHGTTSYKNMYKLLIHHVGQENQSSVSTHLNVTTFLGFTVGQLGGSPGHNKPTDRDGQTEDRRRSVLCRLRL